MTRTGSKTIIAELTRTKADVEALLKAEIAEHKRTKAELAHARKSWSDLLDQKDLVAEELTAERAAHERTKAELGADLREAREAATRNATDCQHLRQSAIALTTERDAAKANELATLQRNADTKLLLGRAVASLQEAAARCSICRGAGKFWPHCDRCSDSTDDHECPLSKPCEQCAPWRAILADTTSAAAGEYVAALEAAYEAVKRRYPMLPVRLHATDACGPCLDCVLFDALIKVAARRGV